MKYLPDGIGLYIHIPFCRKKCAYCDFYSVIPGEKVYKEYFGALLREIKKWGGEINRPVKTVYFGGGTPSLLGEDIVPLMDCIRQNFSVLPGAEITAECNPGADTGFYAAAFAAGVNRLSVGVQAGENGRLKLLGRTHTKEDAAAAVFAARRAGFENISCDIMIALPDSSIKTLKEDIDFICSLEPRHISAYILKIEKNTAFYARRDELRLPDEDSAADQYLYLCRELKSRGYSHYEISNFAKAGFESRHNLIYWRCGEYLGIGPAAHSYLGGRRFYYPRDIKAFIAGGAPVEDGTGGDKAERLMLALRLAEGIDLAELSPAAREKARLFEQNGLLKITGNRLSLTDKGMLVSNSIETELI